MSSIHFRNVIIPAVLMSSAVFSALTLPLVLFEPEPISQPASDLAPVDEPSPIFQSFQPILDIFESGNKGLAIRYIGFSIVASVGAGIFTAELMRQTARRFDLLGTRLSTDSLDDDESEPSLTGWPNLLDADATESSFSAQFPMQELVKVGVFGAEPNSDLEPFMADFNTPIRSRLASLPSVESPSVVVLENSTDYTTCRIRVPHLEKRLFAVLFQGNYYRLVRTRKNRESALAIAARLQEQNNEAIITQNQETYAVWVLEPEALVQSA